MNIQNAQQEVDNWIKEHGVRYFNELTNMAQLTEEVGEVARIIARRYGEHLRSKTILPCILHFINRELQILNLKLQ